MTQLSAEHLRQFIERIERLAKEKEDIAEDIKEVFHEAKGNGFEPKIMREILKLRKKEANELQEEEYLIDVYRRALGMLPEME